MNRRDFDIDHIDPKWEEGRDYQLVCGFKEEPKNLRVEDPTENKRKNNRFIPWRWISDEIGQVPCNLGDLAYFLVGADIEKDIPGEWVLMEFLSEEWYEATSKHYGRSVARERWVKENPDAFKEQVDKLMNWCKENREESLGYLKKARDISQEKFRNMSEDELKERSQVISEATKKAMANLPADKRERLLEGGRKGREKGAHLQHLQRWMCTVTGYITTPAPLSRYQKARGIDHKDPNNRIRIN